MRWLAGVRRLGGCGLLLLLTVWLGSSLIAEEARLRKGQMVRLSGTVTDTAGKPLEGVTVHFEASRKAFSLRRLGRGDKEDTLRLPAVSNARGEYSLDVPFDPYYNVFELVCSVPIRRGGREALETFCRVDLGDRLLAGGVLETALVVEKSQRLLWLLKFNRGEASADERRIVDEMGHPDRVEEAEPVAGAEQGGKETSWWYFAVGKAYYFLDGTMQQVVHFDPILPAE